jgi:Short C-terminal domain/Phospholipase_D-nuclease N-terminal
MIASSYPLLDVFWTMLWFVGFVIWIWLLIVVFSDIFRSPDLSGFSKALWVIGVIILPLLGVLIYLLARGRKMHEHQVQHAQAQDAALRQYVNQTNGKGSSSPSAQLTQLADLRDRGVISEQEFQQQKTKVLASQITESGMSFPSRPGSQDWKP